METHPFAMLIVVALKSRRSGGRLAEQEAEEEVEEAVVECSSKQALANTRRGPAIQPPMRHAFHPCQTAGNLMCLSNQMPDSAYQHSHQPHASAPITRAVAADGSMSGLSLALCPTPRAPHHREVATHCSAT